MKSDDPRLPEYACAWMKAHTREERERIFLWCTTHWPSKSWKHGLIEWAYWTWKINNPDLH